MATFFTLSIYECDDYALSCNTALNDAAELPAFFFNCFESMILDALDYEAETYGEKFEGMEALSIGTYNCDQMQEILAACGADQLFDGIEWLEGIHEY